MEDWAADGNRASMCSASEFRARIALRRHRSTWGVVGDSNDLSGGKKYAENSRNL